MRDVVVITGSGNGIGEALAKAFLKKGETVCGLDLNTAALQKVTDFANEKQLLFEAINLDITEQSGVEEFIAQLENSKRRIRIWIHSAGMPGLGDFQNQTEEDFDRVLDVNLLAVIRMTRRVLAHMEKNGFGQIVTLGSVSGFVPAPMMTAYSTSKHALVGFHRSMSLDLKLKGSPVKTLLVSPGFVKTDMIRMGQDKGFPEWLGPVLAEPEVIVKNILRAIEKEQDEILPTLNGKVIRALHLLAPKLVQRSSKLLLARSWKDILLNNLSTDL
jgi:short-subunit dehydrogenase